ncbi:TonB-dependent siderophore receptor [Acidimangrovimonas sediminis]|uniref:TonB-dependent siderophore receptor n=1 Tax=Acidimangrovimonas sediminis TaxID=2056283 RepID=UPI001304ACA6|nr:TonB-dependent siderophore receptor [Acidimangrovimonas sediminis]
MFLPFLSRRARLLGRTALTCLALGVPVAGLAQTAETAAKTTDADTGTTALAPITVKGAGDGTGPVTSADPVTATGSANPMPVTEIPQSVSVVSDATLKASNADKLDGALGYVAGVVGQPYGYDSDTNWIFVRGFQATATGSFQDGLPNYSYAFGGFYIDPVLVERIEVLKGAASVLYGGANPGGIVNYVTKAPDGSDRGSATFGLDSEGRVWATLDKTGHLDDTTDYRLIAKSERVDGHGMFDAGFHGVLSGSLRKRLDSGAELSFGIDYTRVDESHAGSAWLPYYGTVAATDFGSIPRDFNTGEPGHDSYSRNQLMLRFGWKQQIGAWQVENKARLARSDVSEDSVYAYGYAGYALTPTDAAGTLSRLVFDQHSKTTEFADDLHATRTVQWAGAEHSLTFGAAYKYFRLDQVQASATGTALTVVDPQYGAAQPAAVPYIDQPLTQNQLGVYAQDQIRWGAGWIATLNARYDWIRTEAGTNAATGAAGSTRTDTKASYRLGLARNLPGGWTPYVSASSCFNPQIVNDSNGAKTSPETGRQVEAGVKWAPNRDFLLTAAVFDIRRKGVSQSAYDSGTGGYVYSQIGEVRSRGAEIEAQGRIAEGLKMTLALTKMNIEVQDDIDPTLIGKTPYSMPEEMAALKLDWTPGALPDWTFSGGVRWTGGSWADNADTLRVPPRAVYDIGVSHAFGDGWSANLAIRNVTDKTYVASCQTAYWCYYGERRNASLSITKTF